MSNLTNALIIVMSLNVIMFLGQIAITEINPNANQFYNCEENILGNFEAQGCSGQNYTLNEDISNQIPDNTNVVQPTGSISIITDTFNSIVTWFKSTPIGRTINYIFMLASTPSQIAKMLGLPEALAFAVGVLWYGITLFFILAFIFGRWD